MRQVGGLQRASPSPSSPSRPPGRPPLRPGRTSGARERGQSRAFLCFGSWKWCVLCPGVLESPLGEWAKEAAKPGSGLGHVACKSGQRAAMLLVLPQYHPPGLLARLTASSHGRVPRDPAQMCWCQHLGQESGTETSTPG